MHLKVNHVEVCRHYACGGVIAAMQSADLGVLNGWIFDVHTGKLIDLKIDFEKFLKNIMEIYHLD